jgi:hypothetical protein
LIFGECQGCQFEHGIYRAKLEHGIFGSDRETPCCLSSQIRMSPSFLPPSAETFIPFSNIATLLPGDLVKEKRNEVPLATKGHTKRAHFVQKD